MTFRHPFPGPGLGVRILGEGETVRGSIATSRRDLYFRASARGSHEKVEPGFCGVPSGHVGRRGDNRYHDYVVALRAVETADFMTAKWAELPYDFLDRVSRRIINEVKGISRVVYDISGNPGHD